MIASVLNKLDNSIPLSRRDAKVLLDAEFDKHIYILII